jgi:hypothetical protein
VARVERLHIAVCAFAGLLLGGIVTWRAVGGR